VAVSAAGRSRAGSAERIEAGVCPASMYFSGTVNVPRRPLQPTQPDGPVGIAATGRITRLFVGQLYGFIRVRNGREVFFHRSDLQDVTAFNTLQVGDVVTFGLIDDRVSGARAVRVARSSGTR
jgi:cold shock CspA family protein